MPCERCGGTLERYELGENRAGVCANCGFVDVAVSHEREAPPAESWAEAIDRFNDRHDEDRTVRTIRTTADD